MTWVYDKDNMMWRRDLNVRVIFSPLRGWFAVHSMKGPLPDRYGDADTAKQAADKAWPQYTGLHAETENPPVYIWPPPPKKTR